MAQFDVYRNPDPGTRDTVPYLADIQSDFLSDLATRLVVPLLRDAEAERLERLTPVVIVDGEAHLAAVQEMAAIPARLLRGAPVASIANHRDELVGAIDFLVVGF